MREDCILKGMSNVVLSLHLLCECSNIKASHWAPYLREWSTEWACMCLGCVCLEDKCVHGMCMLRVEGCVCEMSMFGVEKYVLLMCQNE